MHELAICHALLQQVRELVKDHSAIAVTTITVRIGPFSGVEPQLLSRAFELAREGTVAQQALLILEEDPPTIQCELCHNTSPASNLNNLTCPHCGSHHTRLISGESLLLQRVELETP